MNLIRRFMNYIAQIFNQEDATLTQLEAAYEEFRIQVEQDSLKLYKGLDMIKEAMEFHEQGLPVPQELKDEWQEFKQYELLPGIAKHIG